MTRGHRHIVVTFLIIVPYKHSYLLTYLLTTPQGMVWYSIVGFNVPVNTLSVILESTSQV